MTDLTIGADKQEVSAAKRWLQNLRASDKAKLAIVEGAKEGAHVVRGVGEGAVSGGILGTIAAYRADGLDMKSKDGKVSVPLDGVLAVVAGIGAVATSQTPFAQDLRNVAISSAAVCAYRKTESLVKEMKARDKKAAAKPAAGRAKVHGEDFGDDSPEVGADDPILEAARSL